MKDENKTKAQLINELVVLRQRINKLELSEPERKRAEEENEKIRTQLFQAQKMEAIGRLAGGVAHDFNNLLQTITGYSDLLLNDLSNHDPLREDIEEIRKAGKQAALLTSQLLAFSRKQSYQPRLMGLNAIVADMDRMLRRLIGEDIDLVTILDPGIGHVKADPGQIDQVIMNLVVNACDAMPDGGRLTITTENVILDKTHCKVIPNARPGRFVCLSVADTGVGMAKATLDRIFEPFFSTKEPKGGTGLGLSTVYGIVDQHEGLINVYTKPGQGSTFKVYLPAFSVRREAEIKETISLQDFQGDGERILVVEDERQVRKLAARMLRTNGYIPFPAANAKEALDIFEREKGKFHLVFSDVILPDKTGLQLVDRLLSRKPELPVLLCTGYPDQKSRWPTIRERGFRYFIIFLRGAKPSTFCHTSPSSAPSPIRCFSIPLI